jgi:hypothetical protein
MQTSCANRLTALGGFKAGSARVAFRDAVLPNFFVPNGRSSAINMKYAAGVACAFWLLR